MRFEFATATKIIFGVGAVTDAALAARELGGKAVLVSGSGKNDTGRMAELLAGMGMAVSHLHVSGEPEIESILRGLEYIRNERVDVVVALGGGSVLDSAKAMALLAGNDGDPMDYLEVVGKGMAIPCPGLPMIAVPTTAGTGSEVTRNAVLGVPSQKMKVSLRSPFMLPKLAVIDPELCVSMPPEVTASTGMDALAQVIEPFVSSRSTPFTDIYCREGMQRIGRSLALAYRDGKDISARTDMSFASLLGGLALANSGLGAVHGFASPLGGMFAAPHGALCARLLAPTIQVNLEAIERRAPTLPALVKYTEVAHLVTGRADTAVLINWLDALCNEMQIPFLSAWGIKVTDIPEIVAKATSASSMKANPIQLTGSELTAILERAL
jgi:alcohol dehydrogenase class IV